MTISSFPIEALYDRRVGMECATNECVASLELIAEHAVDAPALVRKIESVASLVARFTNTKHSFRPGRVTRLVEDKYEAMAIAMTTLVEHVREKEFSTAAQSVDKIHQIARSVSLLLQVEAN